MNRDGLWGKKSQGAERKKEIRRKKREYKKDTGK